METSALGTTMASNVQIDSFEIVATTSFTPEAVNGMRDQRGETANKLATIRQNVIGAHDLNFQLR